MQPDGAALGLRALSRLWVSCAAVSDYHHGNALSRAILSLWRGPGTHNYDMIGNGKMLQNIAVQSSSDRHDLDTQVQQRPVGAPYDGAA